MIDKNFDREHLLVDTTKCVPIDFSNTIDFSNDKKRAQEYIQEPQNVDYLGDVEKGKEMTFTEADSGNVPPHFEENEGCQ